MIGKWPVPGEIGVVLGEHPQQPIKPNPCEKQPLAQRASARKPRVAAQAATLGNKTEDRRNPNRGFGSNDSAHSHFLVPRLVINEQGYLLDSTTP